VARLEPGVYETLVTGRIERLLAELNPSLAASIGDLSDSDAADRLSRHVAELIRGTIEALPEEERAAAATYLVGELIVRLAELSGGRIGGQPDQPIGRGRVLGEVNRRRPDGSTVAFERPFTPLLDTTILTNSHGEPQVGRELLAECRSADRIDALVAFVRFSGIRNMLDAIREAVEQGRAVRLLTTTYTNSTEPRALDALVDIGAEVKVSYDTSLTRLHAKAWLFHRASGYSTAYIGSSNLTFAAQQTGLEWNVRVSGARNPDVVEKMSAVFDSYWQNGDFIPYDREEFLARTRLDERESLSLPDIELVLRPFQEQLLDQLDLARARGHHRNLVVAATGTGKTVMAATDYARLRRTLPRARLLFVAHRDEILEQSRATFALALRDASFGERWVGGDRPERFEHVFASIQSVNATGLEHLVPDHFDVVIVDEFHHAAAPSYQSLLHRVRPRELLGLTATPERADGLDVLQFFDGRIAAELRLWDAIDQQHLCPFDYFGVFDGADLSDVTWRRGQGYDPTELTNLFTADYVWANRVIEQVDAKVGDPRRMRALGFCVGVGHAKFMAERFTVAGIPAAAISGESPMYQRRQALADLRDGRIAVVFTVDLFNEGVDLPTVDTLLMLRPTDSPTLFLQQLGRGLRKAVDKPVCTVLDFVSHHRKEFRYDRRFGALLGGSRQSLIRQVEAGFPFLPAGCQITLDRVTRDAVLRSIKESVPSRWRDKCAELAAIGDVGLARYLEETGLDLDDIYDGGHSWTEMRRVAGFDNGTETPEETAMLRAVGRLGHVDDDERRDTYRRLIEQPTPPTFESLPLRDQRLLRMLLASITTLPKSATITAGIRQLWANSTAGAELAELLQVLNDRTTHVTTPLDPFGAVPLRLHARYTRLEILAALGIGTGVKPMTWQTGVLWDEISKTDLFAFTLDKSRGGFSPTTRYRDYAISRELIHWESQSTTAEAGETGRRYIHHQENGTRILLFARLNVSDRAFWCLGPATYVGHQGERPIAFTWRLDHRLPADLYTSFAAAVA
jgi:superfamily II DNA or RNA helicase